MRRSSPPAPTDRRSAPSPDVGPGRPRRLALLAAGVCGALGAACSAPGSASPAAADVGAPNRAGEAVAFVGATVLPMDGERVLPGHTVLVEDGEITQVVPADRYDPPGHAHLVDASGMFLIPGLAEMHAHIPGGNTPQEVVEDLMFLYVANGVTTIRGMLGHPSQFELRDRILAGEVLGPMMYLGAPSLNGNSAPTPDAAERLVRAHVAAGYDFQKIHPGVPRDAWDRMVAVAGELDFTFAGHVPADVGLHHALETGMSTIDHVDGYERAVFSDAVRARLEAGEDVPPEEAYRSVDAAAIRAVAEKTRRVGTWVVPTMYLWENFYRDVDPREMIRLPEMRYVPREMREGWARQKERRPEVSAEAAGLIIDTRRRILKALADAGVGLLMGTDSPQMFNVPGFALHRELGVMAASGLSPRQILESGTRNVGRYVAEDLGLDGRFGTVAPGQRADLVLLRADPMESVENLRNVAGVMVRGRWVPAREIEARLAEIESRYRN